MYVACLCLSVVCLVALTLDCVGMFVCLSVYLFPIVFTFLLAFFYQLVLHVAITPNLLIFTQ